MRIISKLCQRSERTPRSVPQRVEAPAEELSKAIALYAGRTESALASFIEKAAIRGVELQAAAAVRFNQFRGLPANAECQTSTTDRLRDATDADKMRIATAAEQAVADSLQVESEGDRRPPPPRWITLVKSEQVRSRRS